MKAGVRIFGWLLCAAGLWAQTVVVGSGSGGGVAASVAVTNFPATQPVSATFWQATQPVSGSVAVSGTPTVTQTPATSGGCSNYTGSIGNTATAIKTSAGQLYGYHIYNSNSTVVYVQLFDLATGSVTVGTSSPKLSLGIPPSSGATLALDSALGTFATAITFAVTTTRTGATSPSNTVDVNFSYK